MEGMNGQGTETGTGIAMGDGSGIREVGSGQRKREGWKGVRGGGVRKKNGGGGGGLKGDI